MALSSTGTIKFSQIQAEHGGANPIKMSEYYRNGSYVTSNNSSVGTSGRLDMSDFRGTVRAVTITYEMIGGGGAGGFGVSDGGSSGRGGSGSSSTLNGSSGGLSISVTAAGGQGGRNGYQSRLINHDGQASHYGSGGAGGNNNSSGSNAPASHYGSAGGGGGGDASGLFDRSGNAGEGGNAGTRKTGSALLVPGTSITVVIGSGGPRNTPNYDGGAGAGGYARITKGNNVSTYSSPGTYTYTVPS